MHSSTRGALGLRVDKDFDRRVGMAVDGFLKSLDGMLSDESTPVTRSIDFNRTINPAEWGVGSGQPS